MPIEKVLLIDDEDNVRVLLHDLLEDLGCSTTAAASLQQARSLLAQDSYDLVICDIRLKDGDGLAFVPEVKKLLPRQKIIVMSGFASIDSVIQALRNGAFDYLIKPIDRSQLEAAMHRLNSMLRLEEENRYLRNEALREFDAHIVWGKSDAMKSVREMVQRVGQAESTVLIQGESGTGKEVIARAIHEMSARVDKPFIKVNCAAIPTSLMESEFFGHEKGAFTGATQRRLGRFELADGGTLLLDEITEIPQELQVKLLRVLQEREFERIGGNKTLHVDVRVLATTNRNILQEVKAGNFREDLYYRLNVFPIHLPPLRERSEDVLEFAQNFLKQNAARYGVTPKKLSKESIQMLRIYSWPGNVRELQNIIERAIILVANRDEILPSDLSLESSVLDANALDSAGCQKVEDAERDLIFKTLERLKGNRTHAAKALGISLRTLRNRLRDYRKQGFKVHEPEN